MVSRPGTDEQKGTATSFTAAAKETAVSMLDNTGSSIRSQISLRGRVQFLGGVLRSFIPSTDSED